MSKSAVAKKPATRAELVEKAAAMIRRAREQTRVLMKEGVIAPMA